MVVTYRFGRIVEHDPRSKNFVAAAALVQRSVLWPHHAPILDQGDLSSCVGNALAQCLNTDYFVKSRPHGKYLDEAAATKLYSLATKLDGVPGDYPPDDTGTSGNAACKAGRQLGYLSGYRWTFNFASFCLALQKSPMIVGVPWYQRMTKPDRKGFITPSGAPVGGHEVCALGIDYSTESVTLLNSWGEKWGEDGRCRITFKNLARLLKERGDATVPLRLFA